MYLEKVVVSFHDKEGRNYIACELEPEAAAMLADTLREAASITNKARTMAGYAKNRSGG
jgi:hypothetical protein